ncbi:MAG: 30S ribosomal protein S6e [Candidatus Diapherotrites archaeon]|nr:30S ribosomal protein S6e [Candidatus Diapherotrites archaeon]
MKIVVSNPEDGKSYQKELEKAQEKTLYGKRIGDKISGDTIGLTGYELVITGGSDKQGFPMRADLHGTARKKVLLSKGPGFHPKRKGERRRKSVRGNTISEEIAQVNMKVSKKGKEPLEKLFGKGEEEKKEEKEKK